LFTLILQSGKLPIFYSKPLKRNLKKGFRVVFEDPNAKEKEADILPSFVVGEKGPHQPSF
jgi:hypothetical protein